MAKKKEKSLSFDELLNQGPTNGGVIPPPPVDVVQIVSTANPSNFIDIVRLNGDAIAAKLQAEQLVIKDDQGEATGADLLRQIKDYGKQSEDLRTSKVGPFNELVKRINGIFKPVSNSLLEAENIIKSKVIAYRQYKEDLRLEEERKRQAAYDEEQRKYQAEQARLFEEESKRLAEIEKQRKEAEKKKIAFVEPPKVERVYVPPPAPPPIILTENKTSGSVGSVSLRKVWRFKVTDISKIPIEFLMVDETLVKAKIIQYTKQNIDPKGKIPGIEIYQEDTVSSGR